jgi:hypothetical protein
MGLNLGRGFTPYLGKVIEKMPVIKLAGEIPVSVDLVLQMQFEHPETWGSICIFTGDAILTGTDGDGVIDTGSALLYSVNEQSRLQNGGLVLEDAQYEAIRYSGRGVLLSAAELAKAHEKGYVRKNGVWQPENSTVGYVWEVLTNGRDLKNHAAFASQRSHDAEKVMCLSFDQGQRRQATLRACLVYFLNSRSCLYGHNGLGSIPGHLVGVAPGALEQARSVARDQAQLRTRLEKGLEQYVARPHIPAAVDYVVREAVQFAAGSSK